MKIDRKLKIKGDGKKRSIPESFKFLMKQKGVQKLMRELAKK